MFMSCKKMFVRIKKKVFHENYPQKTFRIFFNDGIIVCLIFDHGTLVKNNNSNGAVWLPEKGLCTDHILEPTRSPADLPSFEEPWKNHILAAAAWVVALTSIVSSRQVTLFSYKGNAIIEQLWSKCRLHMVSLRWV